MRRTYGLLLLLLLSMSPTIAHAKFVPFNTGDALYRIDGAPDYGAGFSLGYACQHVAVLGADLWSWDCNLMAVNTDDFSVAELGSEEVAAYQEAYTPADRSRDPWNHYGGLLIVAAILGYGVYKKRRQA